MARPAVAVQLTGEPPFLVPSLTSRWEDTVRAARESGLEVALDHLPMAAGSSWTSWLGGLRGGDDDVLVVARPQDLPSLNLVTDLVAALEDGAALVAPRPIPLDADVAPPARGERVDAAEAARRVSGCLAVRVGTVRALLAAGALESHDHDSALAALSGAVRADGGDVRVVPTTSLFRDRRVDAEGVVRDASAAELTSRPEAVPAATGHPAVMPATALHQLLTRLHLADAVAGSLQPPKTATGPFLTVVTRTRGTRPLMLADALTSLAAQTDRDFEVLLACHRVEPERLLVVRDVVAAQPGWLRDRVRLLMVDRPGRSAPLNDALDEAAGRYVTVLDDDDTVLGHWVATFREAEAEAPGRVLRALAVRQYVEQVDSPDGPWPASVHPPETAWPSDFDLAAHLHVNSSPIMTVAFPRGMTRDLALRFDESLPTTEDWDFLVRAAGVVGVQDSHEVTSVYRWAEEGSSRGEHHDEVWERGHERVRAGFDRVPHLLPTGSAVHASSANEELLRLRTEVGRLHRMIGLVPEDEQGEQDGDPDGSPDGG